MARKFPDNSSPDALKKHEYYKKNKRKLRKYYAGWYRTNKEHVLHYQKERYERIKVLKGRPKKEKHPNWKGDQAKRAALHQWVGRNSTKRRDLCEGCGKTRQRLQWANIDHKYRRVVEDYLRLCRKCHYVHDVAKNLCPPLGVLGRRFKPGQVAWNRRS